MDNLNEQNQYLHNSKDKKVKKLFASKDEIAKMIIGENILSFEEAIKHKHIIHFADIYPEIKVALYYDKEHSKVYKSLVADDGVDVKQELLRQYSFEIGALKRQLAGLQPKKVLDDIERKFSGCAEAIRLGIRAVIDEIKKSVADITFKPVESIPDLFSTDPFMRNIADAKKNIKELKKCLAITGACRRKLVTTVFKELNSKYTENDKVLEIISEVEKEYQSKRKIKCINSKKEDIYGKEYDPFGLI